MGTAAGECALDRRHHARLRRERTVVAVPGEDLVRPFAGQHDRCMAARLACEPVDGQKRLIADGLVERAGHLRQQRGKALLVEVEMMMAAADRRGELARVFAFVVFGAAESHREREHAGKVPRGDRGDERAVESAGKEHADRNVGDEARGYRMLDERGQRFVGERRRGTQRRHVVAMPFRLRRRNGDFEALARQYAAHVAEDRRVAGNIMEREIARDRQRVVLVTDPRQRGQRAQIGAVGEATRGGGVEQRLFAETVAREMQHARIAIENRQRVHAVDALEEPVDAPAVVPLRKHLGVARRRERRPRAFELGAQRAIVVDLAVLEREHAPVARGKRLPPRREIDHREPPHAQRDARLDVQPFAVGATQTHRVEHHAQDAFRRSSPPDRSGRRCRTRQDRRSTDIISGPASSKWRISKARSRCSRARTRNSSHELPSQT